MLSYMPFCHDPKEGYEIQPWHLVSNEQWSGGAILGKKATLNGCGMSTVSTAGLMPTLGTISTTGTVV